MSTGAITCEAVDERDLDSRYLSGDLSAEEAEAFEAHYFGCERCWTLVQQALEVRAGLQQETVPAPSGAKPAPRRRLRWWGLAAAAGLAVVALGIWTLDRRTGPSMPEDVLRGDSPSLVVAPSAEGGRLRAAWPSLSEADVYRARLYTGDGALLLERETGDTSISVATDELPRQPPREFFWQIQALDRLRNTVARSDLVRATSP